MTKPNEQRADVPEDLKEAHMNEIGQSYASAAITGEVKPTFVQSLIERIATLTRELAEAKQDNVQFEANFAKRESHWISENARLETELAAERQKNERLSAPVSDEEIAIFATFTEDGTMLNVNVIADFLASRAASPARKEENDARA